MKKILFAIALAVVATACHTNEGDTTNAAQAGSIVINAATRNDVADSSEEGRFYLADAPAAEELQVKIEGNDNIQTWATLADFNAAIAEGLRFISAPYTITLWYGEKGAEGWSKPYFEGSASVEVPMYALTAEANIEATLQNSILAIEATDGFNGYFPQTSFKVKSFTWEADKGESLYLNVGSVKVTCKAVNQIGTEYNFEANVALKPAIRHRVVFDLSTAGSAKVNIIFDDNVVEEVELEFELNENA